MGPTGRPCCRAASRTAASACETPTSCGSPRDPDRDAGDDPLMAGRVVTSGVVVVLAGLALPALAVAQEKPKHQDPVELWNEFPVGTPTVQSPTVRPKPQANTRRHQAAPVAIPPLSSATPAAASPSSSFPMAAVVGGIGGVLVLGLLGAGGPQAEDARTRRTDRTPRAISAQRFRRVPADRDRPAGGSETCSRSVTQREGRWPADKGPAAPRGAAEHHRRGCIARRYVEYSGLSVVAAKEESRV